LEQLFLIHEHQQVNVLLCKLRKDKFCKLMV